jgi:hypothetical protein
MKLTLSGALIFLLLAALVGLLQVASVSGASNGREKFAAKLDGTQMCLGFMADFFVLTHWLDSFREVALKCW